MNKNMNSYRRLALAFHALFFASLFAGALHAQTGYPSRPVTLVVPYPPGGSADILARTVGQKLSVLWGQPVIVDNRAGAGTAIGAKAVASAPADGYTC